MSSRYEFKRQRLGPSDMREPAPAETAATLARLIAAGLTPEAAEKVAQHPRGGPVILAPGIVISVFALHSSTAAAAS